MNASPQGFRYSLTRRATLTGLMTAVAGTAVSPPAFGTIMDFVVIGRNDWLFAIYDQVHRTDVLRMKAVIQVINDAVDILKHAGVNTAIALTPAKSRIYREFLPADFQFNSDSDKRYALSLAMLREGGALVPDLAAVLLEQRRSAAGEQIFFTADTHWTGEGAEAAASAFAGQINAKLCLPASSQPGMQLGPLVMVTQSNNDLAEGLPEAMKSAYGPQSFSVHQILPAAEPSALVDDDVADVLLVGNSFMHPRFGFAPMLSNQLERPISLAWKVHRSSPYKTLLSSLGAEQFRKLKPKLLVWNFAETDMLAKVDDADNWGQNAMNPHAFLIALRAILDA